MKHEHVWIASTIAVFLFILFTFGAAFTQGLGTADVEVLPPAVVYDSTEEAVFNLSEDDALIATCSAILLVVGKTEAASWFATILNQKIITDFLFDVISIGLKDGDFSNEELEAASASCIVVMENSGLSGVDAYDRAPKPSAPPPGAR